MDKEWIMKSTCKEQSCNSTRPFNRWKVKSTKSTHVMRCPYIFHSKMTLYIAQHPSHCAGRAFGSSVAVRKSTLHPRFFSWWKNIKVLRTPTMTLVQPLLHLHQTFSSQDQWVFWTVGEKLNDISPISIKWNPLLKGNSSFCFVQRHSNPLSRQESFSLELRMADPTAEVMGLDFRFDHGPKQELWHVHTRLSSKPPKNMHKTTGSSNWVTQSAPKTWALLCPVAVWLCTFASIGVGLLLPKGGSGPNMERNWRLGVAFLKIQLMSMHEIGYSNGFLKGKQWMEASAKFVCNRPKKRCHYIAEPCPFIAPALCLSTAGSVFSCIQEGHQHELQQTNHLVK